MRILITGASGMLARAVIPEFERRGHDVVALDREGLDVTDMDAVRDTVSDIMPDVVIQCAGYTHVDQAEREEGYAFRVNAGGAGNVAMACRRVGARMVYPSTDYVFDGEAAEPYGTDAPTGPLNAYGRSKLAGEETTAREADEWLVVRTSWLYGGGGGNFISSMIERARSGEPLRVVADQLGAPTWTGSLARILADLIERAAPTGIYHAANDGWASWHQLATEALWQMGLGNTRITALNTDDFVRELPEDAPPPARRPAYSVLDCSGTRRIIGRPLQEWRDALTEAIRVGEFGEVEKVPGQGGGAV